MFFMQFWSYPQALLSVRFQRCSRDWLIIWPNDSPCVGAVSQAASLLQEVLIASRYKVKFFKDLVSIEWMTYLSLGTATFIDILIASSLCYLLATSRTGFSRWAIHSLSGSDVLTQTTQHRFIHNKACGLYHQYRLSDKVSLLPAYPIVLWLTSWQYLFDVNHNHSEAIFIVLFTCEVSEGFLQCAVLPTTFIFIGLQFLVTKRMINNTFYHDRAD